MACGDDRDDNRKKLNVFFDKTINPQCNLHTLVRLLRDVATCDQMERIKLLLHDMISALGCGFWVQDLFNVMELIQILICRSELNNELDAYLKCLLSLLGYVPLLTNTNEILDYKVDIEEYFSFFGFVMIASKQLQYRKFAIEGLAKILRRKKSTPLCAMNQYWVHRCIENSNLTLIISEYLSICSDDIYHDLIQVTYEIAKISDVTCYKMMESHILQYIMIRLDPEWQKNFGGPRPDHDQLELPDSRHKLEDPLMLISILLETLSKCASPEIRDKIKTPSVEALWGVRYALRVYVINQRKVDRNFVMAILLRIIDSFPDCFLLQSGLIHDIGILATFTEQPCGGHWASQVHFCSDNEDFDFKRMLLIAVGQSFDMLGVKKVFKSYSVNVALMRILDMNSNIQWGGQFYCKLILTVLCLFDRMMHQCAKEFYNLHGVTKMIDMIRLVLENFDPETLLALLKTTYRFLNYEFVHKLVMEGEIDDLRELHRSLISGLLEKPLNTTNQKLIAHAYANMGLMRRPKSFHDLKLIVKTLQRFCHPRQVDIGMHPPMFIYCLLLLWKQTANNYDHAEYFVKNEGIYMVLDIIKDSIFVVQLVALGFLIDVLEEGLGIEYFVTWQKDGTTLLKLLLKIFRKECDDIIVKWLPRGVVADPKYPIMGELQKHYFDNVCELDASPSMTDMLLSCRPRIYAILQLLVHHHEKKFEAAQDYFKTFEDELSIDDKITKLVCENYLVMKLGESWRELKSKFKETQLDIVPVDRYLLDTVLKYYYKWGEDIQKMQRAWLRAEYKNEHYQEEEFYNLLRESKLEGAITGLMEMKYLARVCNPKFRKPDLKDSELNKDHMVGIHRTHNTINNFFQAFNQKLVIQSDVIIDPFAEIPPHPVSDDEDQEIQKTNEKGLLLFDELRSDISSVGVDYECPTKIDETLE